MTRHVTPPSLAALRARFAELFGNPPPAAMRAAILSAAIAWKEQVLVHGDIEPALARDLAIIARECRERRVRGRDGVPQRQIDHGGMPNRPLLATRPPAGAIAPTSPTRSKRNAVSRTEPPAPLPPASSQLRPGARLVRAYAGVTHVVEVTADGFIHDGCHYGSLSAVARAITGTHWNGLLFFGLRRRKTPGGSTSKRRREQPPHARDAAHG